MFWACVLNLRFIYIVFIIMYVSVMSCLSISRLDYMLCMHRIFNLIFIHSCMTRRATIFHDVIHRGSTHQKRISPFSLFICFLDLLSGIIVPFLKPDHLKLNFRSSILPKRRVVCSLWHLGMGWGVVII